MQPTGLQPLTQPKLFASNLTPSLFPTTRQDTEMAALQAVLDHTQWYIPYMLHSPVPRHTHHMNDMLLYTKKGPPL
jgi:hypothetical protein